MLIEKDLTKQSCWYLESQEILDALKEERDQFCHVLTQQI